MNRMPVLFLSHGAPTLVLSQLPARDFMIGLAAKLPQPKAVLCISAHWEAPVCSATGAEEPSTIHDFYGFPKELYEIRYAAPGAPDLAKRATQLLQAAGIKAVIDHERGLDHGVWSPLSIIYPSADIPIVQLSLMQRATVAAHAAIGRALAPLRDAGILIIGSGGATHNLRALDWSGDAPTADWVRSFDNWLAERVDAGDIDAIVDYRAKAPDAPVNHPTEEHFMPLAVAMGAAAGNQEKAPPGRRLHTSFTFGSLSMSAFAWGL